MQFFLGNRRPRFIAGLLQIRNLDFAGKVGAIIHAGRGLTWSPVTIEITASHTIRLKPPGQEGKHPFSKRTKLYREHPHGILMTLAVEDE